MTKPITDEEIIKIDFYDYLGFQSIGMTNQEKIDYYRNLIQSTSDKEKRYCKGCFLDVTDKMFCICGESVLAIKNTYSKSEIIQMNI